MKPNIPENPRNIRISTYLTAEEVSNVAKIVGDQSMAAWLRELVLSEIRRYMIADQKAENAELQKQVDELKSENTELYKEYTTLIAGSILEKQNMVKDTAKEIIEELDLFFKGTTFRKGYEFKKIDEKLKEIAKRKGVEVE